MLVKKGYVVWNETKIKIAELLNSGKDEEEILNMLDCGVTVIRKVKKALKLGQPLPGQKESLEEDKQAPATTKPSALKIPLETDEITEASALRLIPKVQSLPLTPNIFIGYMCAIKRGFDGEMGEWLDLASLDYWQGRNVDPYKEVSGVGN